MTHILLTGATPDQQVESVLEVLRADPTVYTMDGKLVVTDPSLYVVSTRTFSNAMHDRMVFVRVTADGRRLGVCPPATLASAVLRAVREHPFSAIKAIRRGPGYLAERLVLEPGLDTASGVLVREGQAIELTMRSEQARGLLQDAVGHTALIGAIVASVCRDSFDRCPAFLATKWSEGPVRLGSLSPPHLSHSKSQLAGDAERGTRLVHLAYGKSLSGRVLETYTHLPLVVVAQGKSLAISGEIGAQAVLFEEGSPMKAGTPAEVLIEAACVLIQDWLDAGSPAPARLRYGFENFSHIVGGTLMVAGLDERVLDAPWEKGARGPTGAPLGRTKGRAA